jgi:hypothetical protein
MDHEDRAELVLAVLKGFVIAVLAGGLLLLASLQAP